MSEPRTNEVVYATIDEKAMTPAGDVEIRALLCEVFPDGADNFAQTRNWHGSGPAWSVICRRGAALVGHIGLIRRVIRVGTAQTDIFGVQNFAVHASGRGTPIGATLMAQALAEARRRGVRWGLLFCIPALEHYYVKSGWRTIDVTVTMIDPGSGRDAPIPGKNSAMAIELAGIPFPAGDLHLQGADW